LRKSKTDIFVEQKISKQKRSEELNQSVSGPMASEERDESFDRADGHNDVDSLSFTSAKQD